MATKVFVDSNLVVYTLDAEEPAKREKCRELLRQLARADAGVISTQVLQETYVTATKKLGLNPVDVRGALHLLDLFEVVTVTPQLVFEAIDCSILNQLSLWDALIVAAAASANCETLWTEDLNAGQVLMGVRVENPLAAE